LLVLVLEISHLPSLVCSVRASGLLLLFALTYASLALMKSVFVFLALASAASALDWEALSTDFASEYSFCATVNFADAASSFSFAIARALFCDVTLEAAAIVVVDDTTAVVVVNDSITAAGDATAGGGTTVVAVEAKNNAARTKDNSGRPVFTAEGIAR